MRSPVRARRSRAAYRRRLRTRSMGRYAGERRFSLIGGWRSRGSDLQPDTTAIRLPVTLIRWWPPSPDQPANLVIIFAGRKVCEYRSVQHSLTPDKYTLQVWTFPEIVEKGFVQYTMRGQTWAAVFSLLCQLEEKHSSQPLYSLFPDKSWVLKSNTYENFVRKTTRDLPTD